MALKAAGKINKHSRLSCLSSADPFSKLIFSKKYFRNIIRVSNSSDPDQARQSVGPDLDPNCLKRLSADDNSGRLFSSVVSWNSAVAQIPLINHTKLQLISF